MTMILTAIMVLLFLFLLIQSLRKPQWALLLVAYFLPLEQLLASYIPYLARNTSVTNLIVGGTAVAAVGLEYVRGNRPFRGFANIATVLVAVLYLLTIAGMLWAPNQAAARHFITTGIPYYGLLLVLLPALANLDGLRQIRLPMIIVGMLIAVFIILSPRTVFYGTRMFVDLSYATGSSDSRGNPLVIGELGGMLVILSVLLGGGMARPFIAIVRVAAALLGVWLAVVSATRGQLIFAVTVALVCYPLAFQVKDLVQFFVRAGAVMVGGAILLLVIKLMISGGDTAERWSASELGDGLGARTYYARGLLNAYFERPGFAIQGLGTGSFNEYVHHESEVFIYPHNLFVEMLGEHGLIGFATLIAALVAVGLAARRLIRVSRDDSYYRPTIALTIAMFGFMFLISMKQGSFAIIPIPFHWLLILAKIERRYRLELADEAEAVGYDEYLEGDELSEHDDQLRTA